MSEGFRLELTDADDAIAVDTGQWTNRAFVSHKWPYYVYVLLCCVANGVVEDMDMDPREGEREGGGTRMIDYISSRGRQATDM